MQQSQTSNMYCWHWQPLIKIWTDCINLLKKQQVMEAVYAKTLGSILCDNVCLLDTRTIGTRPIIRCSLKQPVCFCQVLSALGTLFCNTHTPLYLGAGGYRLPLHNSEEPLMCERQMCLYCKQERGEAEWCRAMPRDALSARGLRW